MSWARAVLIAIGFFFLASILLGQFPSYIFTVSTGATLAHMEQGFLDIAVLSIGIGILCFTISLLYDPRPLLPWPLFALVGLGIAAIGLYTLYQVSIGIFGTNIFGQGGWNEFLPSAVPNGNSVVDWPIAGQTYLGHPAWLQLESIDLKSLGMMGTIFGFGLFVIAVLNPFVLSGRLLGPARDLMVRLSLGLAIVIGAIWLTVFTFTPQALQPKSDGTHGAVGNVLIFIGLMLALFALIVWLLPVMTANRQQFMPSVYLHGVVGLLASVGIPFLILWALIYPVVNAIHNVDSQQFWVSCSKKNDIPGSCTFSPFTGYIICAIVFTSIFGLFVLGMYFWSTRRNSVVLAGTIGLVWVALAATVVHVDDPVQLPIGMLIATGIIVMAFIWTWGNQREFAPVVAEQLGCMGQWLILGTLLLVYLFGFAAFSLPSFFEVEALGLFYSPGRGGSHDAFWGLLLMGGLAAFQFTILARRGKAPPMSNMKKFAMVSLLIAIILMLAGAIIGFHNDVLVTGINGFEGAHGVFLAGIIFEVVGVVTAGLAALRAGSLPWAIAIGVSVLIGAAVAFVMYNLSQPYPELVVFGFILVMVGAFAYVAAGPEPIDPYEQALLEAGYENGNGSFVVGR